ncbi:MAG: hypothetical protein IJA12_07655 [Oscillospiraceae bacterium]|nr:hypothetical protein [Oscillospiraceae bacterium]
MKNFIKYLKLFPTMLFPYYCIVMALLPFDISFELIVFLILTFTVVISVLTVKTDDSAKSVAKQNLIVKAVQIPAYIFYFIFGIMGFLTGIWGIMLLSVAIVTDLITIILTGIFAIGCNIKIYKQGVISKKTAVITSILSFVYCADLVVAIMLFLKSKVHKTLS